MHPQYVQKGHTVVSTNAVKAADGKLNFSKFRKMAQVVLAFKEYQQLAYNLVPIPAIQLMILNGNVNSADASDSLTAFSRS